MSATAPPATPAAPMTHREVLDHNRGRIETSDVLARLGLEPERYFIVSIHREENVDSKARLEDLYLPYKPKRRTRAQIAREAGLEPLADALLADPSQAPETAAATANRRGSVRRQPAMSSRIKPDSSLAASSRINGTAVTIEVARDLTEQGVLNAFGQPHPEVAAMVEPLACCLRAVRRAAGSTYPRMGERVGCSAAALSQAANGRQLPSSHTLHRYLRACGVEDPAILCRQLRRQQHQQRQPQAPSSPAQTLLAAAEASTATRPGLTGRRPRSRFHCPGRGGRPAAGAATVRTVARCICRGRSRSRPGRRPLPAIRRTQLCPSRQGNRADTPASRLPPISTA